MTKRTSERLSDTQPCKGESFTHVYLVPLPETLDFSALGYPPRDEELSAVMSPKVRLEKYSVFRLLEYAARASLGVTLEQLAPTKGECGRWYSPICDFSLSHSKDAVAVAISTSRVGVDIEKLKEPRSLRFPERILTNEELSVYGSLPEQERKGYLISAWCCKEAVFKALGESSFIPSSIDTLNPAATLSEELQEHKLSSDCLEINGEKYAISVFSHKDCHIKATLLPRL